MYWYWVVDVVGNDVAQFHDINATKSKPGKQFYIVIQVERVRSITENSHSGSSQVTPEQQVVHRAVCHFSTSRVIFVDL